MINDIWCIRGVRTRPSRRHSPHYSEVATRMTWSPWPRTWPSPTATTVPSLFKYVFLLLHKMWHLLSILTFHVTSCDTLFDQFSNHNYSNCFIRCDSFFCKKYNLISICDILWHWNVMSHIIRVAYNANFYVVCIEC